MHLLASLCKAVLWHEFQCKLYIAVALHRHSSFEHENYPKVSLAVKFLAKFLISTLSSCLFQQKRERTNQRQIRKQPHESLARREHTDIPCPVVES